METKGEGRRKSPGFRGFFLVQDLAGGGAHMIFGLSRGLSKWIVGKNKGSSL
jgi:hypothetical protein